MKPNVGPITPVASRMFIVYESIFFIDEDWVPQEEVEIGLLETLNNELVRDVWDFAHLKFLWDLFHSTPSECRMVRILDSLESVCLGETVEECMTTFEEQLEREFAGQTAVASLYSKQALLEIHRVLFEKLPASDLLTEHGTAIQPGVMRTPLIKLPSPTTPRVVFLPVKSWMTPRTGSLPRMSPSETQVDGWRRR